MTTAITPTQQKGNSMSKNFEDAHDEVARIFGGHTQETLARNPSPDPIHHLVDAVLALATVIRMQDHP